MMSTIKWNKKSGRRSLAESNQDALNTIIKLQGDDRRSFQKDTSWLIYCGHGRSCMSFMVGMGDSFLFSTSSITSFCMSGSVTCIYWILYPRNVLTICKYFVAGSRAHVLYMQSTGCAKCWQ